MLSFASIGHLGARAAASAIVTATLAVAAAAMVPAGSVRLPDLSVQPAHLLIPNKPPPVSGYRGPNGPICRRVCVGSGGTPQRPAPCNWQTVCN